MIELLARLDLTGAATHYGVVWLRVAGIFLFLPILGSELLPLRIRLTIAFVLAFVFAPFAPRLAAAPADTVGWVAVGVRELAAGIGLGLAARMIFAGIEGAAGIVAAQSGFALANMIDPTSGDQALTPTLFQNLLATALFLAGDLHHLFVHAVVASYDVLAPAAALPSLATLDRMTALLGTRLFVVALELAAPALVVTVTVDLILGLVGRAMPQVPILMVGYPLKMAAGLVAIVILATTTAAAMGWIGRTLVADGARVVTALAGS
jgi:flagellar biosynthetic protein FliR